MSGLELVPGWGCAGRSLLENRLLGARLRGKAKCPRLFAREGPE